MARVYQVSTQDFSRFNCAPNLYRVTVEHGADDSVRVAGQVGRCEFLRHVLRCLCKDSCNAETLADIARRLQCDSQPFGKVLRDNLEIIAAIAYQLRKIPDYPKRLSVGALRPQCVEFLALRFG